jgi:hypothetical protein
MSNNSISIQLESMSIIPDLHYDSLINIIQKQYEFSLINHISNAYVDDDGDNGAIHQIPSIKNSEGCDVSIDFSSIKSYVNGIKKQIYNINHLRFYITGCNSLFQISVLLN